MKVEFLDLRPGLAECEPHLSRALGRVRDGGRFVLGPEVGAFEQEFAALCETRHCVGVGSGLDALALPLRAWGVGPGDEVIVPAYTAVATWMAVAATGARAVGVDVDPDTRTLDPARLEAAITSRTRAVVPVHLCGIVADVEAIGATAAEHGLAVLEDAAHAHGARRNGRPAGSLGAAGAFSFYPTKNLGALGDGGAVTTDDDELAERLRRLRGAPAAVAGHGPAGEGYSSRLDELQAAVLRVKLGRLDAWNRRRAATAARYRAGLEGTSLRAPRVPEGVEAVWHLFVVTTEGRDELARDLAAQGIATRVPYDPPPHLTQTFRRAGWSPGDFPVAEGLARRGLSLPLHPHLSDEAVEGITRAVAGWSAATGQQPLAASG